MGKRDNYTAGDSELLPSQKGVGWKRRHKGRREFNLRERHHLEAWASRKGYTLDLTEKKHWILTKPGLRCEWWPGSAKLVLNQEFDHSIHVHDWLQVIEVLAHGRFWPRLPRWRQRKSRPPRM